MIVTPIYCGRLWSLGFFTRAPFLDKQKLRSTTIWPVNSSFSNFSKNRRTKRVIVPRLAYISKLTKSTGSFIELKYAPDQFLPNLSPLCDKYEFSPRMLETVRSKMRRMGIIDHVSRFNKRYGYREGWVFSNKFVRTLNRLISLIQEFRERKDNLQEQKDRDVFRYL